MAATSWDDRVCADQGASRTELLLQAAGSKDGSVLQVHRDHLDLGLLQDVAYTAGHLAQIADASAVRDVGHSVVHYEAPCPESGLGFLPSA